MTLLSAQSLVMAADTTELAAIARVISDVKAWGEARRWSSLAP